MKHLFKNAVLTLLIICMTLTYIGNTGVSAASYKKSASKTISVEPGKNSATISFTLKQDAAITFTVKATNKKSNDFVLSHYTCETCGMISDFGEIGSSGKTKATGKYKLKKGTHLLELWAPSSTATSKQTVKLTIKASNGKKIVKLNNVKIEDIIN